jgi:quercetin dioxygenase-like cupin family protein
MSDAEQDASKFQIFRAADAKGLMEVGCMTVEPFTPVQRAGMDKVVAAGMLEGDEVKVLCNLPGFSLTHVWFKKDYPLPLHSHDVDCLYYIIAGSVRMGSEMLGPQDTFFIPANVPYAYKPGPDGAELLEFRHATSFNFVNHAKGAAFWDKAAATVAGNREDWKHAARPTLNVAATDA